MPKAAAVSSVKKREAKQELNKTWKLVKLNHQRASWLRDSVAATRSVPHLH